MLLIENTVRLKERSPEKAALYHKDVVPNLPTDTLALLGVGTH
jgi:hypothetical protein